MSLGKLQTRLRAPGTIVLAAALAAGAVAASRAVMAERPRPVTAHAAARAATAPSVVGMRRLTEAQYRNAIADIFGADIRVAGRFEPIVRPAHELIASGARASSISPSGMEQLDATSRAIAAQVFDARHRGQFVSCAPKDAAKPDDACARATLAPLGRYLFRRPLTQGELGLYAGMAGQGALQAGSFDKGLELSLAAMLVSPRFLYVIETAEPDPSAPGGLRLDNYSRASRLSFMLWNTTPGESLLKAAERGELTDPVRLEAVATQMIAAPRFEQGLRAFFADMLLFEKFDELAKDPVIYPYFNQDVAKALPEQTLRTITGHLLTRGGDYRGLFTTPYTYMTRSLGPVYQVQVHRSQGWEEHRFAPGDDRAGLLGQAGFLAMYSHSGRSSPTLRGKAIRELMLCQPVPPPPGNVNFTAVQDVRNKAMPTAKVRLNAHTTDAVCAGCHKITDPAGLSLERFDGIGQWRASENDAPIDPEGAMDGKVFSGAAGLGKTIAESPDAPLCVTSRALEYATGRSPDDVSPMVEELEGHFAAANYGIKELFLRAVTMPQAWRVPGAKPVSGEAHVALLGRQD